MQLALMAGLMVLSWLIKPKAEDQQTFGPRMEDLKVQSSTFGLPIPILHGTHRLGGILIDSSDLQEHSHTEEQEAGKGIGGGGASSSYTWYSYTASFAVAFCAGPVAGIIRIWAGPDLIYDQTGTSTVVQIEGLQIARYLGTETQEPDATLESIHGAGQVPGHRGIAYVVFKDMDLTNYGNSIPNITAEVTTKFTDTYVSRTLNSTVSLSNSNYLVLDHNRPFCFHLIGGTITKYDLTTGAAVVSSEDAPNGSWYDIFEIGADGSLYATEYRGAVYGWDVHVLDPDTLKPKLTFYDASGYGASDISHSSRIKWLAERSYNIWNIAVSSYTTSNLRSYDFSDGSQQWSLTLSGGGKFQQILMFSEHIIYAIRGVGSSSYLYRIDDGKVDHWWDLSSYITYATYLTYDITNGCLLIGSSTTGRLIRFDIDSRTGGGEYVATLNGYVGQYQRAAFKIGPRYGKFMLAKGAYIHEIDVETMTRTNVFEASDWGLLNANGGAYHPLTQSFITSSYNDHGLTQLLMYRGVGGSAGLDSVVSDICTRRDSWMSDEQLGTGDIDVTGLVGDVVPGYAISGQGSRRAALEPLMLSYNVDACLEDNKIVFVKEGGAYSETLVEADLSAHETGEDMPEPLLVGIDHELELPCQVSVTYPNPSNKYEQSTQYSRRLVSSSQKVLTVDLSIVFTDDIAAVVAERILYKAWTSRFKYQFTTGIEYAYLSPTDVIYVQQGGNQYRLRVEKTGYGSPGLIPFEAVEDNPLDLDSYATGAPNLVTTETVRYNGPTRLYLIDCPMLRDVDNDAGFYLAACGYVTSWAGCNVFRSTDSGVSYLSFTGLFEPVVSGVAVTALPSGPTTVMDEGNTVDVIIFNAEDLYSDTEANVLNGYNVALLGDDDRWEVIQWVTGTLIDAATNKYRLSRLIRGRRGTEWAIGLHQVNDKFILLSENYSIMRRNPGTADLNLERLYRAVTVGDSNINSAVPQSFTNSGVSLKPYSPVHIKGARDGSGNLTLTWIRRTRVGGEWRDYSDAPLGEDSEAYEVDIMSGVTVKRTITGLSSETASYTAAQQVTDFGSTQSSIHVHVYQVSATLGRGYVGEETV